MLLIDDALFVGAGLAVTVAPAPAQQTPATYCASLPATSCEVLNVDISTGMGQGSSAIVLGGAGIIKYCRNGQFAVVPISVQPAIEVNWNWGAGGGAALYVANSTSGQMATAIAGQPGQSGTSNKSTAWTTSSLCGILP